jgi:hypothetical protein
MRRLPIGVWIFSLAAAAATPLSAQRGPAPMAAGPPPGMLGAPAAQMLLAETGALQLTDAQVVRLAAIARRAEDRHRALRTRLDSLRPRRAPGDTSARRDRMMPPTDLLEREREATHTDLRDALTVLTADQQARAWEMAEMRRSAPFAGRGMMRRDGGRDGERDGGRRPERPGQ